MSVPLDYKDSVTLVLTGVDDYGNDTQVEESQVIPALVVQNTGYAHGANQDAITSDAYVYIDVNNDFVADNYDRLEEMYCIIEKYGNSAAVGWYKVTSVEVYDDILLNNLTDNIQLNLKKTDNIYDVS